MIYFSLPQNVNYSPPPPLRKVFYATFFPILQTSAIFYSSLSLSLHSGSSICNIPSQFKVFVVQIQIFRFFMRVLEVFVSLSVFPWIFMKLVFE
jgi:hypothetical protein